MKSGNFIEQMFIYKKLREFDNTIQNYGGIHEVVRGEFSQIELKRSMNLI